MIYSKCFGEDTCSGRLRFSFNYELSLNGKITDSVKGEEIPENINHNIHQKNSEEKEETKKLSMEEQCEFMEKIMKFFKVVD